MKLAVLIIGQNQNDYIGSMLEKLARLEADRYWVLDRCTDDSASTPLEKEYCKSLDN